MSAALGQDMKSSSIQLGQALNDPIKGITALSRVGVSFTEQQKSQIKRMVETGDTMGAQKVILRELNREFKGSAEAQATPAEKARTAWNNFKEDVGTAILPALDKLADWFRLKALPAVQEFAGWFQVNVTPRLREFAGYVTGTVVPAIQSFAGWVRDGSDWLLPLVAGIGAAVAVIKIISAVTKVWATMQALLNAAMAANPIGIVVVVLAALAAAFVVAYKKSDTFRRIVNAAWDKIRAAVGKAWDFIKRVFELWKAYLTGVLFPVIRFLWDNVVKPVFGWIGDKIQTVWRRFIRPTFDKLKEGVDLIRAAFKKAVDAIGRIWDGLKEAARKPVAFVVNTVYNNGIRKVVNAIPGVGNLPEMHFARGGEVPLWAGQRGKDSVRAMLMPDEHVWTAEEVRKAGGHKKVKRLRELAKKGRLQLTGDPGWDWAPRFAEGGGISPGIIAKAMEWARQQAGKPYIWGGTGPGGFDCSGFMSGIANVIRGGTGYGTRYGTTSSFPWPGFQPGWGQFTIGNSKSYGHMGGTLGGLAVESTDSSVRVGPVARGAGDRMFDEVYHLGSRVEPGGPGAVAAWVKKVIGVVKDIADRMRSWLSELTNMGGWGGLVKDMTKGVVNGFASWANSKVPGPGPFPTFDRGGMLPPGLSLAYNGTGAGEHQAVFTQDQWRALQRVADRAPHSGITYNGDVYTFSVEEFFRKQEAAQRRANVMAGLS